MERTLEAATVNSEIEIYRIRLIFIVLIDFLFTAVDIISNFEQLLFDWLKLSTAVASRARGTGLLADRTNGRAIVTVLRPSSSVCLSSVT